MPNPDVRKLIFLLDAESKTVREKVVTELLRHTTELETFLKKGDDQLPPELIYRAFELLRKERQKRLKNSWVEWLLIKNQYDQLEAALSYLSDTLPGDEVYPPVPLLLDAVCEEYEESVGVTDAYELNRFLFEEQRFKGATREYYHPRQSNLGHVLTHGEGLPISLVAVYMLVGHRLNLKIKGFNLPGHFLARVDVEGVPHLIDCFNKGRILDSQETFALSLSSKVDLQSLMTSPPKAEDIVTRVLVNLSNAYYRAGQIEHYQLSNEFLSTLRGLSFTNPKPQERQESTRPRFNPGQLVRHQRYGYRGVIVDVDTTCQADDEWYYANLTQPDKKQPWYHVLVDSSNVTTYAAQGNLRPDTSEKEIHHPLIPMYFTAFKGGRYVRNDVPWNFS